MSGKLSRLNIIDIESTCWRHKPPQEQENDIIEIGICVLELPKFEIIENSTIFVLPTTSFISEYCTLLTTLTQEVINNHGITFLQACEYLCNQYQSKYYTWASWGDYDRKQFKKQCKRENVTYPFGITHLNLKNLFALKFKLSREIGMKKALKKLNIELEGTHHRGIDDARNIAHLAYELLK